MGFQPVLIEECYRKLLHQVVAKSEFDKQQELIKNLYPSLAPDTNTDSKEKEK